MGYKPLEYGEQLNPDKLNKKFDQIFKLLSQAYIHNNVLKRRLDMVNAAFETSSNILTTQDNNGDEEIVFDTPVAYKYYDKAAQDETSYELFVGANQLFTDSQYFTSTISGVKSDGFNIILETKDGEEVLSRIPLTKNEYGELYPSLGVSLTSESLVSSDLGNILSPDTLWGEKVPSSALVSDLDVGQKIEIYITLPPTLTPYVNIFRVAPVPGVQYKLLYQTGDVWTDVSNGWSRGTKYMYIAKDVFGGSLRLDLHASALSTDNSLVGLALHQLEALYDDFTDTGTFESEYELQNVNTGATITSIETGTDLDPNINLKIYDSNVSETVVYDSSINGAPYPVLGSSDTFNLNGTTLKFKFTFNKFNGTTPTLPYVKINYKETE